MQPLLRVEIARGDGVLPLAQRFIVGMLVHELEQLPRDERLRVLDVLFYKLYTQLVPSDPRHHAQIASLASGLIGLDERVWESVPGPGEVFVATSTPDETAYEYQTRQLDLPEKVGNTLKFIRNLRLAANGIDFESRSTGYSRPRIRLLDTTLWVSRAAFGDGPLLVLDQDNLEKIVQIRTHRNIERGGHALPSANFRLHSGLPVKIRFESHLPCQRGSTVTSHEAGHRPNTQLSSAPPLARARRW